MFVVLYLSLHEQIVLFFLEHAHKNDMGETEEVGSASKKPVSSKRSLSLQKKEVNMAEASQSAMSSIKKRLEFMEDKAPKKLFKKPPKSSKEDKGSEQASGMPIHNHCGIELFLNQLILIISSYEQMI